MEAQQGVLAFEAWKTLYEAEEKAVQAHSLKQGDAPESRKPYSLTNEMPPDDAWFKMNKQEIDARIAAIAQQVIERIAYARREDKELSQLRKSALAIHKVPTDKPISVAIVGQQGVGKSSLINAIMHRRFLSKTSSSGFACTASAIRYVHKAGMSDICSLYDATVHFMDGTHLKEVSEEHARRYSYFHFCDDVDTDFQDDAKRLAETAEVFFRMAFRTTRDREADVELKTLLQPLNIANGRLVERTVEMARIRIEEAGADVDGTKSFNNMEIKPLQNAVSKYMAQDSRDEIALWPIVQYVDIRLGSSLTRNSVSIIDLPGLGDLNHSRTAATNATRRQAECELIVARPDRVTTEEVVDQQIKQSIRAHGAKNTFLVLTKIDDVLNDDHSVETSIIEDQQSFPFPIIKKHLRWTDAILDKQEEDLDTDGTIENQSADNFQGDLEDLEAYRKYLMNTAKIAYIQQRAASIEKQMRYKYVDEDPDPINVFSVSANKYLEWMKARTKERPILTATMTGIPRLRHHLLGLSASGNWQRYQAHVETNLPMFLDKIARVTDEKQKGDAYVAIRPAFKQEVIKLQATLNLTFQDFLDQEIPAIWTSPDEMSRCLTEVAKVVEGWGHGVRWNTYQRMLRERGVPFRSYARKFRDTPQGLLTSGLSMNWNEQICEKIKIDVESWRHRLKIACELLAKVLHHTTRNACRHVKKDIEESDLPQSVKDVALAEWDKRTVKVVQYSLRCHGILGDQVMALYRYTTTETDYRCMISQLNAEIYDNIRNKDRHGAWYRDQKLDMEKAMIQLDENGNHVLERISRHVDKKAKADLKTSFSIFLKELVNEVDLFDEHIGERLPVDYDITSLDRQIRESLRILLPQLQSEVKDLSDYFGVATKVKLEGEDDNEGQAEAENTLLEPASKKVKLSHFKD